MGNIRKLESDLWESADLLRAESKLTSQGINTSHFPVSRVSWKVGNISYLFSREKKGELFYGRDSQENAI